MAKRPARIDPRLDAIRYQEMLKKVGAQKRSTEAQAKEAADRLAKLVAALRQMGAGGGETETELDRSNAALKEKDWTAAFNAAQEGIGHGERAAQEAADHALDSGISMMYDVERIGVPPDDLQPMAQEGRDLREAGKFLEQYRRGQELRARAIQQGREHLEEHLQSFAGLLAHDREEGVDTRSPEAILERARTMLIGGDVDFAQVADLIAVQAQSAREAAVRGEPAGVGAEPSAASPVEVEDRAALSEAVEESFRQAEQGIQTARSLKGDLKPAERELARAKSAFDAGDLKAARAAGRRSIVAAASAARRAVTATVEDASAEVRRLRLAGANVTVVRKMLATAKLRMAEGSYDEASGLLNDLVERATSLREEQQLVLREVEETSAALVKITQMQVIPSDAAEPLEEARNYARRGDVERARAAIKRAEQSGREFWTQVTDHVLRQMREYVIEARDVANAQVSQARVHFQKGKQALDAGEIEVSLKHIFDAVRTIQGAPEEYQGALVQAAEKFLVIEVAGKLGIARPQDIKALRESAELRHPSGEGGEKSADQYAKDLAEHRKVLEAIAYDFPSEQEAFVRAIRRTLELENEVEEGKKIGTDMTRAEELLFDARSELSKHRLDRAALVLKEIETDIVTRKDERIEELLKDADADLRNLRPTGVYLDDVAREVREARAQHANHNYEIAVDLIQDAVSTALERQADLEAARREIQRAESLIEQGADYAADMSVASGLLDEARSLSREHDNRDARAVAAQAMGEAQTALAKYIDLILEETERAVDKAEAEHGDFPEWRDRLNEARRMREQAEVGDALLAARAVNASIQAAADMIHEVRQKVALVEAYVGWVEKFTKTVVMPRKLLEHAKERLENFSLEAAREAVNEAVLKAEEAQRQFLREVHEEAFELIDDYEQRGVQLTEARNTMMQAQGMLESKAFEDSYRSAVAAQDLARTTYDLFQNTQRAVGDLETEVQRLETYGIDVSPLTALLEQASAAFAAEGYEAASGAIGKAQALVPQLKEARTLGLEEEVRAVLKAAGEVRGVNVARFEQVLARSVEARKGGDIGQAIELLAETRRDLEAVMEQGREVAQMLEAAGARVEAMKGAGLDARPLEDAQAVAERRLDALEIPEAASILKRAMVVAEGGLQEEAERRLEAVVAGAIDLRLAGQPGESALPAVLAAADALLAGDFVGAARIGAEAEEALRGVPDRAARLVAALGHARVLAARLADARGEAPEEEAQLAEAARLLRQGDLAAAEEVAQAAQGAMAEALAADVGERLGAVESDAEAAESEGADPTAAVEALRQARTALKEGVPQGADHWSAVAARLVGEARDNARRAADARSKAEGLLEDARAFGADPAEIQAAVAELDAAMEGRRHKRALAALGRAEHAWHAAKKARLDGRKANVVEAMQRSAKLGVPQDAPRQRLAALERLAAEEKFEEAFASLEALEGELRASLERRDGLAAAFEEANDLETSFSDLPVDFASCREARLRAREALERFELDPAQAFIGLYRKEVEAVLTAHGIERARELEAAAAAARGAGLLVPELDDHRREAEAALEAGAWREVFDTVDRGLELLEEARKRLEEVRGIAAAAQALASKASPLGIDMGEVTGSLQTAEAKLAEGALEEAKVEADYALKSARGAVATEVDRRIDHVTTLIEAAAESGISIEPERGALRKAREAAEQEDFAKMAQAADLIERSLAAKTAERDRAAEALAALRQRVAELEQFEVAPDEFGREVDALARLEAAHDFKRLLQMTEAASKKVAERMAGRVEEAARETAEALALTSRSKVYVGEAPRGLERARKLLAAGEYLEAYRAARQAERAAYENKDRHDRARQVLRIVEDHMSLASSMAVDTADLEALRTQAVDAFEFQSYDEAASIALDAYGKLTNRLKGVLEERIGKASSRVDSLELAGAAVESARRDLQLAKNLMDNDDLISAEVSLGGTERRIEQAAEAFARARETVEGLTALIDVADLLGVDAKAARRAAGEIEEAFGQGAYDRAMAGARAARAELAGGCAAEVEKRIEAAREVLRGLEAVGIPIAPALAPVGRATDALVEQDFVGAFSAAREAVEAAERQRRAFQAARDAIRSARRRLRVAEGLEADAVQGRESLSESEILFRSGDYAGSSAAAESSAAALGEAAAASAGLAISRAEEDIEAFGQSGVRLPPASDSLARSREALALDDFLGSVHYARMAARQARSARRQVEEAQTVLSAYAKALERAGGLLDLTEEDRAALEVASREFEGGQMRRAQDLVLRQQQSLHARAREAHAAAAAEVEGLAKGLEAMGFDASATRNEAKESGIAMEEGRFMDALAGAVGARSFARDQLAERVGARAQELRALVEDFEAAGLDVEAGRAALEAFNRAAEALDALAAAEAERTVRAAARKALEGEAAKVVKGLQRAGEQRFFRSGAGAKGYQLWRSQAADLRGQLQGKDYGKALSSVVGLRDAVEKGLSELLAEKLVEVDAIREAHLPRREATDEERGLYGAAVEAADRGRATLEELDQAERLVNLLRDWSSKFVTDTKNRISRQMMLFEDKAAVEQLKARLAAVDRARGSPAAALQAAYELSDAATELFRARAEGLVAGARSAVEATRAVDADASPVQDFLDRAEAAVEEGQMAEAVDFAESALKEAARLQEARVLDVLKRAKA